MATMPEPERRAKYTEDELALLRRIHRAINDNTQQDVIAAIHKDLMMKKDKYCSYIVAFRDVFPSNNDASDGQSIDKGKGGKGRWDTYLEQLAYISMVWSPDLVQYYELDVHLGYAKVSALYSCVKAYNKFEDFLAHHNLLQWLRHKQSVLKAANKEKTWGRDVKFCPGRKDWPLNDLQALRDLFNGKSKRKSMRMYGCKITLSTAKEYSQRIHEWTKDSDGLVEIDGKQVDLKVAKPVKWEVFLLQYDYYGRLEQRQPSDLTNATPQRNGIISPPASSIAVPKSRLADQDADGPTSPGPSVSESTGTSTRPSSPESIIRRLTTRDRSAPGDHAADVAEVILTDDEGSDGGVASNGDAEESETVQQTDRTTEPDSTCGFESVEPQASVTHGALDSNPKARPSTTVPPYGADASTKGRQEGDSRSDIGDLGDVDPDRDDAGNREMLASSPRRCSLQSPGPTLMEPTDRSSDASNGAQEHQAEPDESPASDAAMTGGTTIGALPDRSARPSPHACSAQDLFVSEMSEHSHTPSTRERSVVSCHPSPPSTIKNNRRPPPLADNSGQSHRNGAASSATKSTRTTIATLSSASSSTATSISHSSSEHDATEGKGDGDDEGDDNDDSNGDAGSTASQPNRADGHPTRDGDDTFTENVRSSNVNLWREDVPPSGNASDEVVNPGERDGFFDLLNKLGQAGEGHPFAYDLPTPQEVIGYGVHRWNRHRGLHLTDCGCDICEDLKPLLIKTNSQASATGASQLCQARNLWLHEAKWASATDLNPCAPAASADSEVLLASHASFKRATEEDLLLDKPVIVRDLQGHEDAHDAKELQRILLDSSEGFPVPVTDVLSCEPKTVAVEDFLSGFSSSEEPVGSSNFLEALEADSPAFVRCPRFRLLRSAVARARTLSGGKFNEVFDRTKAFTRVESSGFFCAPRVGTFGGTWLRVLTGELLCMFVPRAQMTTIMYGDFAREDLQWQPQGKHKLFLLQENDVLVLPPGIICAHVAVGACVSLEGSFWDEKEIGRYATATRVTPECNPPRVIDGIPQRAIDCILDGLAAIVNKSEHRYESDFFYRGNGRFGLPLEIAEAAMNNDDTADRGAKRICQTSGEDAACGTLDETMKYF